MTCNTFSINNTFQKKLKTLSTCRIPLCWSLLSTMYTTLAEILAVYPGAFESMHNPYEQAIVAIFNGTLTDTEEPILLDVLGFYHQVTTHDHELIVSFYTRAFAMGFTLSTNTLGVYYKSIGKFDLMLDCYHKGIDCDLPEAMYNLANYYTSTGDVDWMIMYHMMAIERHGLVESMECLGEYYQNTFQYPLMVKYYSMAAEKGSAFSMHNLACYYNYMYTTKFVHTPSLSAANDDDDNDSIYIDTEDVFEHTEMECWSLFVEYATKALERDMTYFVNLRSLFKGLELYDLMNSSEKLKTTAEFAKVCDVVGRHYHLP